MDRIGLINRIFESVTVIDTGRKWLVTKGLEGKGRVNYFDGLNDALNAFKDAKMIAPTDLAALIISELTFITQELQFCDPLDNETLNSLKQAIQSFDDALLALDVVENADDYRIADKTHPRHHKHRVEGMPKDSFHIACRAHRTRIGNILRSPGINMAEKELLAQRRSNLATAQATYLKKQKAALSNVIEHS